MSEIRKIIADIESVFADSSYPQDFLAAYDQMECLASHSGRETFLVRRKSDGLQGSFHASILVKPIKKTRQACPFYWRR